MQKVLFAEYTDKTTNLRKRPKIKRTKDLCYQGEICCILYTGNLEDGPHPELILMTEEPKIY